MEFTQLTQTDERKALEMLQETGLEFPLSRIHCEPENLPLEEFSDFSSDPISFEEMTEAIFQDISQLESMGGVTNRYSQSYLEISRRLEKGIAELASCAITKTVFEQKGYRFSNLEKLEIPFLYSLVSFHFRKCHAAIGGTLNKNQQFWLQMLEMEMRWHKLAKRLKATENKISLIREGKISTESLLKKLDSNTTAEKTSAPKAAEDSKPKALPPAQAISFPMLGDFLREAFQKKETVPAQIANSSADEPQPAEEAKTYDSIKARKKAERLARKHEKTQQQKTICSNNSSRQTDPASGHQSEGHSLPELQSAFDELQAKWEAFGLLPKSNDMPRRTGGTPPERA